MIKPLILIGSVILEQKRQVESLEQEGAIRTGECGSLGTLCMGSPNPHGEGAVKTSPEASEFHDKEMHC